MEELSGLRSRGVRIGGTVRREVHQNTPAVKALLSHLEETGFTAAPRWLGFDEEGRETLSYITGTAGHYPLKPHVLSESTLTRLGLFVRRFPDSTTRLAPPE